MAIGGVQNIFPTAQDAANELFISDADLKLNNKIIVKAANETVNNSDTLQNDDELFFKALTNSTYVISVMIHTTQQSSSDFRCGFSGPAGTVGTWISEAEVSSGIGGSNRLIHGIFDGSSSGTTGTGMIPLKGVLATGATAGIVYFMWAQRSAEAEDTIVLAGSNMVYAKQEKYQFN